MDQLRIVTGPAPDPLVAFAADELTRYVDRLFGVQAEISADNSDRGAVAALNKFCYRPIQAKLMEWY